MGSPIVIATHEVMCDVRQRTKRRPSDQTCFGIVGILCGADVKWPM